MGEISADSFEALYEYVSQQPGWSDYSIQNAVTDAIMAGYEVVYGGWHIEYEDYYPYLDPAAGEYINNWNISTGVPADDNWQNVYPQGGETSVSEEEAKAALFMS